MKTIILAAAALAMSGTAMAQTPAAGQPNGAKRELPTTRAQAIAQADQRFAAMDTNRDGKISAEERRAFREARRERRESREWTQAEFRDQATRRFDRIDTNKDGTIDAQEREAAKAHMRGRMGGRGR